MSSWARFDFTGVTSNNNRVFELYLDSSGANAGLPSASKFYIPFAQTEAGTKATSYIPSGASLGTRAADALILNPAAGDYEITLTFDDESTQLLADQANAGGGWLVPVGLDRPCINTIAGFRA